MSKHGLQHRGLIRRSKILRSAVKLFLEKGYASTTTPEIMKATGMSASSFFAAFKDKEALLLTLVGQMFESQFKNAGSLLCADIDPLMLYAVETALQMHITELSEPLRELYVTAYTLTSTAEYIHRNTAKKLPTIFHLYQPNATEKDFYELELASSGVTRSYMAKPCDMYFPWSRSCGVTWAAVFGSMMCRERSMSRSSKLSCGRICTQRQRRSLQRPWQRPKRVSMRCWKRRNRTMDHSEAFLSSEHETIAYPFLFHPSSRKEEHTFE